VLGVNVTLGLSIIRTSVNHDTALEIAGTGAVRALAYPLGSKFSLPHGVSNSVMFVYVSEANVPSWSNSGACDAND